MFRQHISEIWRLIKENKDLDIPAQKVLVAAVRCQQISEEKLESLKLDPAWLSVKQRAKNDVTEDFPEILDALVNKSVNEYNDEAAHLDEETKESKLENLNSQM